jgi:hypothetical protein
MRKMINQLHLKDANIKSLQYELNHSKLQLQAYTTTIQELQFDKDNLNYSLSEYEQDIALLKVTFLNINFEHFKLIKRILKAKIKDIAGFENQNIDNENILENLRGDILQSANEQVRIE